MNEQSVRQQLLQARADVQRQIEVLQSGPLINYRGGAPQTDTVIAKLTMTLQEIEDSLAALGDG
jgi:hypothetical protein